MKDRLTPKEYVLGITTGDRVVLAKAITLIESSRADDQNIAQSVLHKLLPKTGNSIRIGITGVPGVGKSTFIETFGMHLIKQNRKVAVLSIDPSSMLTKGSILGDKTRMDDLSRNPMAFVRPTSAGDAVGGVAHHTREAMLLCEAAGYDVILVETVGVGQSEVEVKKMVDFFLLLMLAGAGDELQGIKKGIMEMADAVAITKADGDNVKKTAQARAEYQHAFHLFQPDESGWSPKVLTCSAFEGTGMQEIWSMILKFNEQQSKSGVWHRRRSQQRIAWMHDYINALMKSKAQGEKVISSLIKKMESKVIDNLKSPSQAAEIVVQQMIKGLSKKKK